MSIRWKILLMIVSGGLLVFLASVPLSLITTQSLREAQDINLSEIGFSETIDDSAHSAVIAGYDFLATGRAAPLKEFARDLAKSDRALAELKVSRVYLTFPGPDEKIIVANIESKRVRAGREFDKVFREKATTGRVKQTSYVEYRRVTEAWLRATDRLSAHEVKESLERRSVVVASSQSQRNLTLGLGLLALVLSALAGFIISAQMLRPIRVLRAAADRVGRGELDVTISTARRDELGDLERAFERMRVNLAQGAIERHIAQTLQAALLTLPAEVPGLRFAHAYSSASEMARVGGDFYDLFELEGDRVGVTVGDVSGKGVEASALTCLIKNTVRAHSAEIEKAPADVVTMTNRVLFQASDSETFATLFFGVLDRDSGGIVYCSGGHTAGAILHADGSIGRLPANSPLIGAYPAMSYEDSHARMDEGDTLFLYTDGLIEARRDGGDLFGEERLFDLLKGLAHEEPEALVEKVFRFVVGYAGGKLADDVAVLAVQWLGVPEGEPIQMKLDVPTQEREPAAQAPVLWSGD